MRPYFSRTSATIPSRSLAGAVILSSLYCSRAAAGRGEVRHQMVKCARAAALSGLTHGDEQVAQTVEGRVPSLGRHALQDTVRNGFLSPLDL